MAPRRAFATVRTARMPTQKMRRGRRVVSVDASMLDPSTHFAFLADALVVDGCGVTGGCGSVAAPPLALGFFAIVISAAFLAFVTFGLKGGADASIEMQQRDKDMFNKKNAGASRLKGRK